jgi:beta-mannosidase
VDRDKEATGGSRHEQSDAASSRAADKASVLEEGESFYFRVNGLPLYAKGANLIPLHVLSSAVADGDVVGLLQSAAAANMNMVRIWGGGLYQVRGQLLPDLILSRASCCLT